MSNLSEAIDRVETALTKLIEVVKSAPPGHPFYGNQYSGGGGGGAGKRTPEQVKASKEAVKSSENASKATKAAFGSSADGADVKKKAARALEIGKKALQEVDNQKSRKLHGRAAQSHRDAYYLHTDFQSEFQRAGDTKSAKSHEMAASAHKKAENAHIRAGEMKGGRNPFSDISRLGEHYTGSSFLSDL